MKKNHEILDEVMGTLKSTPDLTDSQYHYAKIAMDQFAEQEADYWKKRCEAAEEVITTLHDKSVTKEILQPFLDSWQSLKQQKQ